MQNSNDLFDLRAAIGNKNKKTNGTAGDFKG